MSGDDAWAGERVARWLDQQERLEAQLAPVSDVLFDAARLAPGEIVVDVGCGTGPTTRTARTLVGALGRVTGIDVSAEMIDVARRQVDDVTIDWQVADVATWRPLGAVFDVVLSRFGVMFFDDPAAAFANLAAATVPGGRLCVAVWATRDESAQFGVPLALARAAMHARGIDPPDIADDEGPFSLGRADATIRLLTDAGWSDVVYEPVDLSLAYGGGLDVTAAADFALEFGPSRLVTADLGADDRAAVRDALAVGLADHVDDGIVRFSARVGIVTARRRP